MANWGNLGSRGNVEDRRSFGPAAIGGGLGVGGLLIVLALNFLGGGDVTDVLSTLNNIQVQTDQTYNAADFEGADSYEVFASTVLGSNNNTWSKVFAQSEIAYKEPKSIGQFIKKCLI